MCELNQFLNNLHKNNIIIIIMEENIIWSQFRDHCRRTIKDVRMTDQYSDVTLICGDQSPIRAHKLVLASASVEFKRMFSVDPDQHSLIYLRGVDHEELKLLLELIYSGEVKVHFDHLGGFYKLASQ